jgi:hypothetical protein
MQPAEPMGCDPPGDGGSREHADGRDGRSREPRDEPAKGVKETLAALFHELAEGAGEISSYLKTLGAIRADRARLEVKKRVAAVAREAATTAALAVLALCGVVLLAAGFGALLGDWFGNRGLGNLVAGVVLLAIVGATFGARGAAKKRKELETHRDKYARIEQEHRLRYGRYGAERVPPAAPRAEVDRGAARPGAGAGSPGAGAAGR